MKLDLKGLKIVWIGMLLSIVGSLCNSSGSRNAVQNITDLTSDASTAGASALGTIGGIIALVAFILVIVGLTKLKNVSPYFKKARNLQIALLILAIIFVVVLAVVIAVAVIGVGSAVAAADISSASTDGALVAAGVVLIVFVVLMLVFGILFNTNLLKGCQQTAKLCDEHVIADKFRKMRKQYIVAIVLVVIGVIVIICSVLFLGIAASAGAAADIYPGNNVQPLIGIIPGAVLVAIGGIIMLVYTILLLVRMAILCKYDGKEIS